MAYLLVPSTNAANNLTGSILFANSNPGDTLSGLTNGTSYRVYHLIAGPSVVPYDESDPDAATPLTNSSRIVVVGDSNTQYGTSINSSVHSSSNLGEIVVLSALSGIYNTDTFYAQWSTNPGFQGSNCGVAGESQSGITTRLTDALKYGADAYVIAGGTNDGLDSASQGAARAQPYIDAAVAGHIVLPKSWFILRAVPPVAAGQYSTSRHQSRLNFNAALKAFADANPKWCRYVDIYTTNIQTSGEAVSGYLKTDGLHYATQGAHSNALLFKSVMDDITVGNTPNLVQNFSANNLAPEIIGTTGTKTNVTGAVSTGYTATSNGTSTIVGSVENGEQIFTITSSTGTGNELLTFTSTANTAVTVGSWYMTWAEIELIGSGVSIEASSSGSEVSINKKFSSMAVQSPHTRMFIKTPPYRAVTGTKPTIEMTITRASTSFNTTVKIKRLHITPVQSPYNTWGVTTSPTNTQAPTVSLGGSRVAGTVVTLNPGTWSGVLGGSQQQKRYRAALYRDGSFIQNIDFSSTGTYTLVSADVSAVVRFDFTAANQAEARSSVVSVTL